MEQIRNKFYNKTKDHKLKRKYSIIIPYMYNGDRKPIFDACIKNLYNLTNHLDNFQITIHEIGPKRHLSNEYIQKYNLHYIYNE